MQKLNTELNRLYLSGAAAGQARAIALAFRRLPDDGEAGHWERLCTVANAVQAELGLPAPAVSISGDGAFGLWISLAQAVPEAQAQEFARLLSAPDAANAPPALPPSQHAGSGKWSAFINPGMGAAFAGDEGLEMQPSEAGQLALLERLESATPEQLAAALAKLRQAGTDAPAAPAAPAAPTTPAGQAAPAGLLLKDATLEDIVAFLHSKNIEPTFRFLK